MKNMLKKQKWLVKGCIHLLFNTEEKTETVKAKSKNAWKMKKKVKSEWSKMLKAK